MTKVFFSVSSLFLDRIYRLRHQNQDSSFYPNIPEGEHGHRKELYDESTIFLKRPGRPVKAWQVAGQGLRVGANFREFVSMKISSTVLYCP